MDLNNLTQSEAKLMLGRGKKISHTTFTDEEYIYIESGRLKDEKGYFLNAFDFWSFRITKTFASG